jgi:hypothetical protein
MPHRFQTPNVHLVMRYDLSIGGLIIHPLLIIDTTSSGHEGESFFMWEGMRNMEDMMSVWNLY